MQDVNQLVKQLNADKIALDQCYSNALRENIQLRSHCLLRDEEMKEKDAKILELETKLEELKKPSEDNESLATLD